MSHSSGSVLSGRLRGAFRSSLGEEGLGLRNSWSRKRAVGSAEARLFLAVLKTQSLNWGMCGDSGGSSLQCASPDRSKSDWGCGLCLQIPANGSGSREEKGSVPSLPIPWASVQRAALQRTPVSDVRIKQGLGRWEASFGALAWAAVSKLPAHSRRMGKDWKHY